MGNGMTKDRAGQECTCSQCGRRIFEGDTIYRNNSMKAWGANFIPGGLGGEEYSRVFCSMGCYNAAHPEKVKASRSRDDDDDEEYDDSSSSSSYSGGSYESNPEADTARAQARVIEQERKAQEEQFEREQIERIQNFELPGDSSEAIDSLEEMISEYFTDCHKDYAGKKSEAYNAKLSAIFAKPSVKAKYKDQYNKFLITQSFLSKKPDETWEDNYGDWKRVPNIDGLSRYWQKVVKEDVRRRYNVNLTFVDNRTTYEKLKNKWFVLFLTIFTGWFGGHCYFVGRIGKGILYTLTEGIFCIGWIIDIFKVLNNKFTDKDGNIIC